MLAHTIYWIWDSTYPIHSTITTEYRKEGESMAQIDDSLIRDIQEGLERILKEIMKEGDPE